MSRDASRRRLPMRDDDGSVRSADRGGAWWLGLLASALAHVVALFLWIVLLAWLVGRVLTDRFGWSQFLWWIPTPAVLIAAALGLLLTFRAGRNRERRRRRITAWAMVAFAISVYWISFEHRLLRGAAPLPSPQSSPSIAHWNMTLDNHADIPGLMMAIAALNADVLAITSPPGEVRRLLHEQAQASAGALRIVDGWPMLLVTRLPVMNWRIVVATGGMFITQVELDATATLGRPITIFLIDLPSSPRLGRMAIAREARRLLDEFNAGVPDVCIGDFNMTRGSASIQTLFPGMTDAYDVAGQGWGATFPRRLPLYHIDHVLINVQSALRAARYEIIDAGQSRHCAQRAWIMSADR